MTDLCSINFIDMFYLNNLKQFNPVTNCSDRIKDLVIFPNPNVNVKKCNQPFIKEDHRSLTLKSCFLKLIMMW